MIGCCVGTRRKRSLTGIAVIILVVHRAGLVALEVLILDLGESNHDGGLSCWKLKVWRAGEWRGRSYIAVVVGEMRCRGCRCREGCEDDKHSPQSRVCAAFGDGERVRKGVADRGDDGVREE